MQCGKHTRHWFVLLMFPMVSVCAAFRMRWMPPSATRNRHFGNDQAVQRPQPGRMARASEILRCVRDGVITGKNTDPVPVSTYLLTDRKFSDFRLLVTAKLVQWEMHSGIAMWGYRTRPWRPLHLCGPPGHVSKRLGNVRPLRPQWPAGRWCAGP